MENELVVQVSMKQEMELAMKLLEKDIHEKQVSMCFHSLSLWPLIFSLKNSKAEILNVIFQQCTEKHGLVDDLRIMENVNNEF